MSKFFKALEQAERERALQARDGRQEPDAMQGMANAPMMEQAEAMLAEPPTPAKQPAASPDADRPVKDWFSPLESGPAPPLALEEPDGVDEHLVSLLTPTSIEAEHYRTLRHLVEQMQKDADLHTVAVTSPAIGNGKTITAINLAGALAQALETRVLLLEADLRRPSIGKHLGLGDPNGRGLMEMILDPSLALQDVVCLRPPFNLAVLPAGRCPAASYEVLKSPRLGEVLAQARAHYNYVVLDTPPLIPFPDCRLLERWVDGFLVVVSAHKTPRRLVEEALDVLDPAKIVGLVFNAADHPVSGYHEPYNMPPNGHGKGGVRRALMKAGGFLRGRHASSNLGAR